MMLVIKVGTSSVTTPAGHLDEDFLARFAADVTQVRRAGHAVVVVASGAIAAGLPALALTERPGDARTLQALAAVGQPRLMEILGRLFADHGCVTGQLLLDAYDFGERRQYLHARNTFERLLELGVVPIVNENDAVAEGEIRYGDNDRIAALVSHLLGADLLLLLTDTPGLFTADPRHDATASLIEEVAELDSVLDAVVGGAGSERGSGGMATKLQAARIAAWSGVRTVIASSGEPGTIARAAAGEAVGTLFHPRPERLESRKLWIAFARHAEGRILIDGGAVEALVASNRSLLPVGVREVAGGFQAGAAVEIVGPEGDLVAKGISRYDAEALRSVAGFRTDALPDGAPDEAVHRDDLVVLPVST